MHKLTELLTNIVCCCALFFCTITFGHPLTNLKEHLKQNSSDIWRELLRNAKAAEMHNYMNMKVDPCVDFYEFSCGKWIYYNPSNAIDKFSTGFFENLNAAATKKMLDILSDKVSMDETDVDKKVKKFYKSCEYFNKNLERKSYIKKLHSIIKEFGQMPALTGETWNASQFDWLETIAKISRKYGIDIIFDITIQPDFLNNTNNRVYFGQSELLLESKAMYLDNSTEKYRRNYLINIASDLMVYLDMATDTAVKTAYDIVNFEKLLAKGLSDDKINVDLTEMTEQMTVDELHVKYSPRINIKKYINITIGELNEPLYEFMEDFQLNLFSIIRIVPKQMIANYVFYRLVAPFFIKFENKPNVICMEFTKKYFVKVLDNMVYRKYESADLERDVFLIWKELKLSFQQQLESNELAWIMPNTRRKAIEKLNAMKLEINSYASENFSHEFNALQLNQSDFIDNIKRILHVKRANNIAQLHEPAKSLDVADITSYSPVNVVIENKIKIPIALLQPFYLWAEYYPNALKFATLGSLIGHELIHGFDDSGRTYDKFGNDNDWWDATSTIAFNERTKCFSEQYKQYVYGGRQLPESESQSENIADNGGLRLAYSAYLKWYAEAEKSNIDMSLESMPYLNYTSKQLFFISFAQIWCNDVNESVHKFQTLTDEHVPGKFRVIGTLSNYQEFADVFQCSKKSPMNPIKKCEIY